MVMTDSNKDAQAIEAIKAAQQKRGWSDGEFSRRLGKNQSQWSRIQSGDRPLSLEFLRAVAAIMPELTDTFKKYAF